jgi:AcrR family transcriptional regulator
MKSVEDRAPADGGRDDSTRAGGGPGTSAGAGVRPAAAGGRGRRPGPSSTRAAILRAAQRRFIADGYERTTLRAIAADARVDPALIHYFFGTKQDLLAAAMRLQVSPARVLAGVLAGPREEVPEALLRNLLTVWDDPRTGPPLVALVRSALVDERVAELLRGFVRAAIAEPLAAHAGPPDGASRATAATTVIMGLILGRYLLRAEPVASASPDQIVALLAPQLRTALL